MQSRWTEAEPLLRECLAICEKASADDWKRYDAMSLLGGALLGQGRYAEAEPLIVPGYEGMKERESRITVPDQVPPPRGGRAGGPPVRGMGQAREGDGVEGEAGDARPARGGLRPAVSGRRLGPRHTSNILHPRWST